MSRVAEIQVVGDALGLARSMVLLDGVIGPALLAHVLGRDRTWVLAHPEAPLDEVQAGHFTDLLARAMEGEPLAYLIGEREFCGLPLFVTPDVLIPRPETEMLVETVVGWACLPKIRIVDVGTGSGAIAVTLATKLPNAFVVAVDISQTALKVAHRNAIRHGVVERIHLLQSDLLSALTGPFDVIVSNLPYIADNTLATLEVSRWEPRIALDGGSEGLEVIRRLVRQAPTRLSSGGLLVLEIGYNQGKRVADLCRAVFPAAQITVERDLAGLDRMVRVDLP